MDAAPILESAALRLVETRAAGWEPSLMERAGHAAARMAHRMAQGREGPVLVVCGPGNNGGDGWVAARGLLARQCPVVVYDVTGDEPRAPEALVARQALRDAGVAIAREWPAERPALVVDALLGIGLARDVASTFAATIQRMNLCGAPVLAIDVPSGLDGSTGCVRGVAVRATRTLTFIAWKPGLLTLDGPDHVGELELDDLGTGDLVTDVDHGARLTAALMAGRLAPRARNSHKGAFGTVAVVGGAPGMVGAALLAARAALHAGAGKVRAALLDDRVAVDFAQPEVMLGRLEEALRADVIVAGPGAGGAASAFAAKVLPAVLDAGKPLVLDADALNAIAIDAALVAQVAGRLQPTILTPHPAEAARLLGRETREVQADRLSAARAPARRYTAHVVLKGAGSVVASPEGPWALNATGNAGLASGGSGDVLAGIAGALLAQGLHADTALRLAVCVHGAAADALVARGVGPVGMTASEVAVEAGRVLNAWAQSSFS